MIEWIITSSVLIIVVIVLRFILKGKINLRLQYAFWVLVLLRLLIPFSFGNSVLSVINLSDTVKEQPAIQTISDLGQINVPIRSYDSAYNQVVREYEDRGVDISALEGSELETLDNEAQKLMAGPSRAGLVKTVLLYIWIAGLTIVAAFLTIANLRFAVSLKKTRQPLRVSGYPLPVYVT